VEDVLAPPDDDHLLAQRERHAQLDVTATVPARTLILSEADQGVSREDVFLVDHR
jgi:hypothetical protein